MQTSFWLVSFLQIRSMAFFAVCVARTARIIVGAEVWACCWLAKLVFNGSWPFILASGWGSFCWLFSIRSFPLAIITGLLWNGKTYCKIAIMLHRFFLCWLAWWVISKKNFVSILNSITKYCTSVWSVWMAISTVLCDFGRRILFPLDMLIWLFLCFVDFVNSALLICFAVPASCVLLLYFAWFWMIGRRIAPFRITKTDNECL